MLIHNIRLLSIKIGQGSPSHKTLKMNGYQISSSGNRNTTHQVRVSVFLRFQCRNADGLVLSVAAGNTQAHSPAANNHPEVRPAHTWNADNSDGPNDATSLAASQPQDGDGEGGRFGRRPGRGGRDDGPRPEGRGGGGGGRRPPKPDRGGPGRGGPDRGGRDDLISPLASPPAEGMGRECLYVRV